MKTILNWDFELKGGTSTSLSSVHFGYNLQGYYDNGFITYVINFIVR